MSNYHVISHYWHKACQHKVSQNLTHFFNFLINKLSILLCTRIITKMKTFLTLTLSAIILIGYAQDTTLVFKKNSVNDSLIKGIVYEEDPRTDALLRELKTYDIQGDMVIIDGYRIQIYFSNERKIAEDQRQKFVRLYPEHETLIEYDTPNYNVRVGAFKTRDEAEEFRASITKEYPMSIIQRQKIKIPLERDRNSVDTQLPE